MGRLLQLRYVVMLCNVITLRYEIQAPALAEPVGLRSLVTAPGRRNGPPRPRPCRAAGAGGWPVARPVSRKGEPTPSVAGQLRAQREGRRSLGVGAQPGAGRRPLGEPPHKRGQLRAQREGRALRWGQRPRPRPGTGGQVRYHPAQRQGPGRRPRRSSSARGHRPDLTQAERSEPVPGSLERHLPARAAAPGGGGQRPVGAAPRAQPAGAPQGREGKGRQGAQRPSPAQPGTGAQRRRAKTFLTTPS